MIIAAVVALGLCFGSFVNALVWRIYEQEKQSHKKTKTGYTERLSIAKGRSMCPNCHHELAAKDLLPVLSWLSLKGKCRYCHKGIAAQYPLVELVTAALFTASYYFWPVALSGWQVGIFGLWLALLIGFMALLVYDLRWMLLPNRIMYPLGVLAVVQAVIMVTLASRPSTALLNSVFGVLVGGGLFYILFQVSEGKWIGGGDVKLGFLLGLILAAPERSLLLIFLASVLGSLAALPLVMAKRLKGSSVIPFGPFLIVSAIIVQLFGSNIINWYQHILLGY